MARGSANEIGRVAKRFSVICLRMGPRAPYPKSGHVQVSFRETKEEEVCCEPGRDCNWDVLSFRCDTEMRTGSRKTMSAFIGEHLAHGIVGEVHSLPSSTSFLSVGGGEERSRKNGRVDLRILSIIFFFFIARIVDQKGFLAKGVREDWGRVSFVHCTRNFYFQFIYNSLSFGIPRD